MSFMEWFLRPPDIEKLKARGNVEGLIKALHYRKASVHMAAVEALGNIGDVRAVEPLISALKDKDWGWGVREGAAEALGNIGDVRAVEPLVAALKDEYRDVREVAAEALDKIGWKPDKDENGATYWTMHKNT